MPGFGAERPEREQRGQRERIDRCALPAVGRDLDEAELAGIVVQAVGLGVDGHGGGALESGGERGELLGRPDPPGQVHRGLLYYAADGRHPSANRVLTREAAMKIAGSTTVITGGASGLGRATAERLRAAGGRVVLLDLAKSPGAEVARGARRGRALHARRT